MSQLIILRGESRSGQNTTAKIIQNIFPQGNVMRISQDEIREDILNVTDRNGEMTAELVKMMAEFGYGKYDYVVLEGTFRSFLFKDMLEDLFEYYNNKVLLYYYDLSFEEAIIHRKVHSGLNDLEEDAMKKWWSERDLLGLPNEQIISEEMNQKEILNMILLDLNNGEKDFEQEETE